MCVCACVCVCVIQEESGKGSANRSWESYRSYLNREGPRALGSKEIPTVSGSKSLYFCIYSSNVTAVIYTLYYMSLLVSAELACACWLFGLFVIMPVSVSCLSLSHSLPAFCPPPPPSPPPFFSPPPSLSSCPVSLSFFLIFPPPSSLRSHHPLVFFVMGRMLCT